MKTGLVVIRGEGVLCPLRLGEYALSVAFHKCRLSGAFCPRVTWICSIAGGFKLRCFSMAVRSSNREIGLVR